MALISTRELMEEFFKTNEDLYAERLRSQIARPELFKYEKEIGKQLVDMNEEELFGLFSTFSDIKHRTVIQIVSFYRSIIDYYSFNYEPKVNHLHRKEFRGAELSNRITGDRKKFTQEDFDFAISRIHQTYSGSIQKQNYLECIVRLFYDGFANSAEIVDIKEEDIYFEDRTVNVSGRTVTLSERTMYLLKYVHDIDSIDSYRVSYDVCDWRGHYFKYAVIPKNAGSFQLREKEKIAVIINRKITIDINRACEVDLNYVNLYYLGVYHKFVKKCGSEELAKKMVYDDSVASSHFVWDFIVEENLPSLSRAAQLKVFFKELV